MRAFIVFLLLTGVAHAWTEVTPKQAQKIKDMIRFDLNCSPAYLWGGKKGVLGGPGEPGDCSKKLWAYAYLSGVRDAKGRLVRRVTSEDMCSNRGG